MRHDRRRTPARRRDGAVKVIHSDVVRYPGSDVPESEDASYMQWRAEGRMISPSRDTGYAAEGRLARERRRRERQRRQRVYATICGFVAVCLMLAGWRHFSDSSVSAASLTDRTAPQRTGAAEPSVATMRAMDSANDPTPLFASYKTLRMRLPVSVEDLTEVGFHQASYSYALSLKTPLEPANMTSAKRDKSTHRDKAAQATGPDAVLGGCALIMWRDRPGRPDTAVDVGASPGSDVYAPLSGTVVKVKSYKLYGKYSDFEIHIRPTGHAEIDCVMIHLTDLSIAQGDHVTAGVTRIGAIRKLSDKERLQLSSYTKGGGNHTHLQLNDATDPDYKGLEGAIMTSGS